jgi:integrase
MPEEKVPQYCLHKATGQAYVKIDGRRIYLGRHDSPESKRRYTHEIDRWREVQEGGSLSDIRIGELTLMYCERHVRKHYVKCGEPTSEQLVIKASLRFLAKHRHVLAADFGPRLLKDVRDDMVAAGLSRETVNRYISRTRQMFEWAVSDELIPERIFRALQTVKALRAGRTVAPDHEPVGPVAARDVFAIRRYVSRQVFAMVKFQLRTGARPGEVVLMRTCDIDMTGRIWLYRPHRHKLEHKKIPRVVEIGPRGQRILRPFLRPDDPRAYMFSPRNSQIDRGRRLDPHHRDRYDIHSYRRAIRRACERAGVSVWVPNQLRHTFATRSRREGGIEETRILMGHTSIATTEIYAEPDRSATNELISQIG